MSLSYRNQLISVCRTSFFGSVALFVLILLITGVVSNAQVNDGHGKEWRQLTTTQGMTWNQVAQNCPQDGITPCHGTLSGWTWATDAQVLQLMSYTEPAMATSRSVNGAQFFNSANSFLTIFTPTASGCSSTYTSFGCFASLSGWTATKDQNGYPIIGSVGDSNSNFGITGGFDVSAVANSNQTSSVWLWRDPNGIYANDDYGQVDSPDGGTALQNVLANDTIASAPATLANVTMAQVSTTNNGVNLNPNGSVTVGSGTPAATYSLVYRICSMANPALCSNANVSVVVNPYTIDAADDYAPLISPSTGGTAIPSVLSNDSFSRRAAHFSKVTMSLV